MRLSLIVDRSEYAGSILAAMLSGAAAAGAPQSADDDIRYERIEPSPKQMAKLQALTPEGVAAGADIHDDDLETIATITTVNAYQSNGGFTDRVRSDNFLRAFVNKRTGAVRYQLYQTVSYNYVYRNFTGVNYAAPDGPRTAPVEVIGHEVIGCAGGPDRCSYKDTLGFDVPEDQLRWVAGQYVAGNSPFWRFKFRSQAGMDWEDRIAPAEAAGVLEAVRRYLIKHGVSGTTHQ